MNKDFENLSPDEIYLLEMLRQMGSEDKEQVLEYILNRISEVEKRR